MKTLNQFKRLIPIALFALAMLAFPGCIPTTWLPDSSGFIYVRPLKAKNPGDAANGQLVHFDLQKKASRVLVDDVGAGTIWPAVSPDGKRIAVSRFKGKREEAKSVQVVIYDLQGKQVQQSKEFVWSPAKEDSLLVGTGMLFWSPKDDMMVVTDFSRTGIFNLRADSMNVLEKTTPAIHGGTPIRPDGKGFLVMTENKDKDKKPRFSFMDWTGAEQTIDTGTFERVMAGKSKDKKSEEIIGILSMGVFFPSGWDGNEAWAGMRRSRMTWQIDTVKNAVSVSDAFATMLAEKKDPQKNEPVRYEFPGDISVQVAQIKEVLPDKKAGLKDFNRVTVVNHKTGKEEKLLDNVPGAFTFSASPNGNFLNVSVGDLFGAGTDPLQILVITSRGELYSKISIER